MIPVFEGSRVKGAGWFRILGVGIAWADHKLHGELMNRRYVGKHGAGYKRRLWVEDRWQFVITTWRNP